MKAGQLLWQPEAKGVERTLMHQFMVQMSNKYGFDPTWPELHAWSIRDRGEFWAEMLTLSGIPIHDPATSTLVGEGMLGTRWFPGMTMNYAEQLLRHPGNDLAIVAEDERGNRSEWTFNELRGQVARCAQALSKAGVERGDRVAGFVPNVPEAIIAMLATASLGAIWSSCSPDFGINGVVDRFGQIKPRVLICADGYSYNGQEFDSLGRVSEILTSLDDVHTVVVIPFLHDSPNISSLPRAVGWPEFLESGTAELDYQAVPFDHPLFIMYSSGTTGKPKCIVHGHGGTLLQHMKELMLHCDLRPQQPIFYFTTCGWMMWNWVVSALGVGATVVLYEGSPSHPTLDCLWDVAERNRLSVFGTSPKFLSACQNAGIHPANHDLSALRCVLSTGAPLAVENFEWVYSHVKQDLRLSSICGGTDIISCFMLGNPMLPVHAGEIQCLGLGMDVHAYDELGRSAISRKGELVCASPFPSQPIGFWHDEQGDKYRSAYFEHYDGVWRHGDFVEINQRQGVAVYGRSDATLNPGGVRIGTAEIYRLVEAMDSIVDSLVVGRPVRDDVEVCLFLVMAPGHSLDDNAVADIKQRIAEGATRRHVPKYVLSVSEIPYTISGKKVELAVSRLLQGLEVTNRDALANPRVLDEYAGILPG